MQEVITPPSLSELIEQHSLSDSGFATLVGYEDVEVEELIIPGDEDANT
jgi:hypothetical protein